MNRGEIQLILGPMFSGKTTELIRRIRRFQQAKKNCMVVKYAKDKRYNDANFILTHDKTSFEASFMCNKLEEVEKYASGFSVIGIDEGQFFEDVEQFAEKMANMNKVVIISALNGTYQRKMFETISNLIPLAESVDVLKAVCMVCHHDAAFSKRKGSETQVELIGGKESYMAVCRKCYFGHGSISSSTSILNESQKLKFNDLTNIENVPAINNMPIMSHLKN